MAEPKKTPDNGPVVPPAYATGRPDDIYRCWDWPGQLGLPDLGPGCNVAKDTPPLDPTRGQPPAAETRPTSRWLADCRDPDSVVG